MAAELLAPLLVSDDGETVRRKLAATRNALVLDLANKIWSPSNLDAFNDQDGRAGVQGADRGGPPAESKNMVNGMDAPKTKITITLRPEVLADIRERVAAGQARSVPAYVEHAIVGQLAAEADFDSLLAELLAETGGPLTDQERASARRVLRGGAA